MLTKSTLCGSLLIATSMLIGPRATFAQGSDACASAQPILGLGTFPFDNSGATTDGSPAAMCNQFNQLDIDNDVWFEWTAPTNGFFQLDTCNGQTTVDTKLGILDGSCAGSVLACNDDTCGLQSQVVWAGAAGSTYLVRLGNFPNASGGTGTFTISEVTPSLNTVNSHHYLAIRQANITWTDAQTAAQTVIHQGLPGHLATITDQTENNFIFAQGNVHNCWVGGYQDLNDPNYSEPAGAWKWVTGEPWGYTNWLPGEPNNMGGFASEDFLELLQGGTFGETWNDVHPMEHPGGYVVEWDASAVENFCFGDGTGIPCPCVNEGGSGEGCANSSGSGAVATIGGSLGAAADDLTFHGANLRPNQPALLFSANNAINGGLGVPFGDGLRCAGGGLRRLGIELPDAGGDASWGPGLGATGGWTAGDTRRFQIWYRDPTGSPCDANFNLSHGVELVFVQ